MPHIYLHSDPVDFHKSYRGLEAIVEQKLEHYPFDGALYAFTSRHRDKISCCSGKTMVWYSTTRAWPSRNSVGPEPKIR